MSETQGYMLEYTARSMKIAPERLPSEMSPGRAVFVRPLLLIWPAQLKVQHTHCKQGVRTLYVCAVEPQGRDECLDAMGEFDKSPSKPSEGHSLADPKGRRRGFKHVFWIVE